MSQFCHLHAHSNFSFDGMASVADIVAHVKSLGQTALALTEHGHVSSWPTLARECAKAGIKPIFGIEANINYNNRIHHITLLAMDNTGIDSIYELVRRQRPPQGKLKASWVTLEDVLELNTGVICLSGCLASICARLPTYEEKLEHVRELHRAFGDRLYLETQAHTFGEQIEHNIVIRMLSNETGILPVLTRDCHYLNEDEVEIYYSAKSWGAEVGERHHYKMYYGPGDGTEEALRSVEIADRCNATLPLWQASGHLQLDPEPALEILRAYYRQAPIAYKQRLKMEIDVIKSFDCLGYFVLLHDIIGFGNTLGIEFGPGRGSAAGSLVAYVLGITKVDPIQHGLYFERFLNPGRKSLPDIDIDVQGDKREEFLLALADRYGKGNVAQVCTYLSNQAASAILAAARALGINQNEAYVYSKVIPDEAGKKWSLDRCFSEITEFQNMHPDWAALSLKLEGTIKAFGVHAAAIIVAEDVVNKMPCNNLPSAVLPVLMYDMNDLEKMGLIKFDLLGLKTLTMLSKIQKITGIPYAAALDDKQTYDMIASGDTFGCFQLESKGCQEVQRMVKVDSLNDISAILAIYRPGPLSNGYHETYANNKHNGYEHSVTSRYLSDTYGVMIYQEQTMTLVKELCKYTPQEADDLRKAIGKKLPQEMEKHKERMESCGHGELYETIKGCAAYQFNKSHSVAYAHLTYWNAYAKCHHPAAWAAAYLETYEDVGICHTYPSLFGPPSIKGINKCHIEQGIVHLPMSVIPGIGPKVVGALLEHAPFTSMEDMFLRVPARKLNIKHKAAIVSALGQVTTFAPLLGIVIGNDPITEKRGYYTNRGLGNTKDIKPKIPGYLYEAEKFVAKGSGKTWVRGTLIDELGSMEFLASEHLYETLLPFVKSSSIIVLSGQITNNTFWLRDLSL